MAKERPLCLACADLDHLVYLPRGDAALTRRATKHSKLSAVVVRFSKARGHYERQRILVEESALHKAVHECILDADQRAARREREEVRRVEQDRDLGSRVADAIRELFPGCPSAEALAVAEHTAARGSGRVGRTAGGKALDERAITAAAIAAIRHTHTRYVELLMGGDGVCLPLSIVRIMRFRRIWLLGPAVPSSRWPKVLTRRSVPGLGME